jgi:hypothetical protein
VRNDTSGPLFGKIPEERHDDLIAKIFKDSLGQGPHDLWANGRGLLQLAAAVMLAACCGMDRM